LHLCDFALKAFSAQATCLAGTTNDEKVAEWQGGKVAELHVVNPATLQPCYFHISKYSAVM